MDKNNFVDDLGSDKDHVSGEDNSNIIKGNSDLEVAQKSSNIDESRAEPTINSTNKSLENHSIASTTEIQTLKPYIIKDNPNLNSQRRRRTRYRPDSTLLHFDHIFGSNNWSRFLILKTESPITAAKLENILLTNCPSRDMSLRQIDEHKWLVETTNKRQSEIYQEITALENVKVEVEKHDKLNSIYGTVVLPHQDNTDKALLLDSLKKRYSNVEDLEIYQIPQRGNANNTLKIAKIKFEGQNLPADIRIMGQRREVRPHVPKPLQCKRCCKFGHSVNNCRNDPVCAFCGSSEHPTRWNCGESKCINCGQQHHARSKECVFYIYNTELKLLMDRTGMKIKEAKLELQVRGIKDPTRNPLYRTVVAKSIYKRTENQTNKVDDDEEAVGLQTKIDKNDSLKVDITPDQEKDMDTESNKGVKRTRRDDTSPNRKSQKSRTLKCVSDLEKFSSKTTTVLDSDDITQGNTSSPEYHNSSSNPFDILSSDTPLERCSSALSLEEQYFDAPLETQNSDASPEEHYVKAQVHAPDISASMPTTPASIEGPNKENSQLTSEHCKSSGALRKTNRNAPNLNRTSLKK